ncbi:MAG TPA: nuclear transport factor 2 family protein [Myxococcota bacterium]|nr:nuclear transport factor 2 family protein [Myxococcota bacterium]
MAEPLQELLDRERIRALASAYAFAVDKRDYETLRGLFLPDARLAIYAGDPAPDALRFEARGQDAIVRALRGIERYAVTSHQLGGQTVSFSNDRASSTTNDHARAETRCLASHLFLRDGARWSLEMAIRYQDALVRSGSGWRFAERALAVDWESERELPNRKRD